MHTISRECYNCLGTRLGEMFLESLVVWFGLPCLPPHREEPDAPAKKKGRGRGGQRRGKGRGGGGGGKGKDDDDPDQPDFTDEGSALEAAKLIYVKLNKRMDDAEETRRRGVGGDHQTNNCNLAKIP